MSNQNSTQGEGQAAHPVAADRPAPVEDLAEAFRISEQEYRDRREASRRRYEETVERAAAALRSGGEALWEVARLTYENTASWIKGPEDVPFSQWVDDVREAAGVEFDDETAWKYRTVWHHLQPVQSQLRELFGLPLNPCQPAGAADEGGDGGQTKPAFREPLQCGEEGCPGKVIVNWYRSSGYTMVDYFGCDRGHITIAQVGGHPCWNGCHHCWRVEMVDEFAPYCSRMCQEVGRAEERIWNLYQLLQLGPRFADPQVMTDLLDQLWPPRPQPPRRPTD